MVLLTPDLGFLFWHSIILVVAILLLSRYGWIPILQAIERIEESYAKAEKRAQEAKEEAKRLEHMHQEILEKTRHEQEQALAEAEAKKQVYLMETKVEAKAERARLLLQTQQLIEREKEGAREAFKKKAVQLVVQATKKLISRELQQAKAHEVLMETILMEATKKKKNTT